MEALIAVAAFKLPQIVESLFALAYDVVFVTGPQVALVDAMICDRGHRTSQYTTGAPAPGVHLIYEPDNATDGYLQLVFGMFGAFIAVSCAVVVFVNSPEYRTTVVVELLIGTLLILNQYIQAFAVKSSNGESQYYRLYVNRRSTANLMRLLA